MIYEFVTDIAIDLTTRYAFILPTLLLLVLIFMDVKFIRRIIQAIDLLRIKLPTNECESQSRQKSCFFFFFFLS